ncbi:energy transducer TonB [Seohaeicola saemankumensis]|nr:energy transducer TonB [Seohaeicola saemankumensis]MCA0873177.1 energy transducer TonB [Seohaeicola saemankumensis]
MQTGTKISAIAHVGLLAAAFLGGAFRSEPLPFEVQEVSVITAEEFAALSGRTGVPEIATEPVEPAAPQQPPETPVAPEIPTPPETRPDPVAPDVAARPEADPTPEPVPEQPVPDTQATDTVAVLTPPAPDPVIQPQPPQPRPRPRPVERVAPDPVAPPPPDARPDPQVTPEVAPEEGAETPQEVQEATAPEEATDRIVPDAEESAVLAPTRSPRPPARPAARPAPPRETPTETAAAPNTDPTPDPTPDPAPAETQSAVEAALAAALGGGADQAPTGPPMTAGEKEDLRVAVSACWNVGSLSSEAMATTVVVAVSMEQNGTPRIETIRMLSSSGGSADAARQAFEAARRAIIRCGSRGYDLPAEKYSHWRDIEMTFNPERMRVR